LNCVWFHVASSVYQLTGSSATARLRSSATS
jgi:hypothetical protein